jgi:hypothetical protein
VLEVLSVNKVKLGLQIKDVLQGVPVVVFIVGFGVGVVTSDGKVQFSFMVQT